MIKPWEKYPHIWKTQAAYMSFIRGGIRKGLWNRNPVKLEFIQESREKLPLGRKTKSNPEGLVWGCKCNICKKDFRVNEIEVDHLKGNHSLKSIEDLRQFIENIVFVDKKDLQILCKGCHRIKSYAEKEEIPFELAKATKKAIQIQKEKDDKRFLTEKGVTPKGNAKERREQLIELLMKEGNDE